MTMGYEIHIIESAGEGMCPLCGLDRPIRPGPIIVQRPSGDVVCEECAEQDLAVLLADVRVLRDDAPTDFPEAHAELTARLTLEPEHDTELSRLVGAVFLQRSVVGG
jgi:hypothetical protein